MDLGFEIKTKQEQKLNITPELKQSLDVLQYTSQELNDFLRIELERNPLLEMNEEERPKIDEQGEPDQFPVDWKEYFISMSGDKRDGDDTACQDEENNYPYESNTDDISLYENLMLQLEVANVSLTDKSVCAFIIRNINDNGYLTVSKLEIASLLNADREKVSKCLKFIQSFDPPGVGARSLRECLLIQLKRNGLLTQEMKTIVLEHLKDIAGNHCELISKKLNISIHKVQQMCDLIKTLEPKPGRPFADNNSVRYIIPDVDVEKVNDDYIINLRDFSAPRLRINKVYQSMLGDPNTEAEVTQFIMNSLHSAHRVIKAIDQRRSTINRVVSTIVHHQREFLDKGILYLKPLTLKMVGEDIDLHESTISRAVNGKYLQTPRGVYELKYFFDNGIVDANGKAISSQSIKQVIYELIQGENLLKPYSDSTITELLSQKGIEISRRTVAKYREEINIPSSAKRKRF